jgi:hypothetical protein
LLAKGLGKTREFMSSEKSGGQPDLPTRMYRARLGTTGFRPPGDRVVCIAHDSAFPVRSSLVPPPDTEARNGDGVTHVRASASLLRGAAGPGSPEFASFHWDAQVTASHSLWAAAPHRGPAGLAPLGACARNVDAQPPLRSTSTRTRTSTFAGCSAPWMRPRTRRSSGAGFSPGLEHFLGRWGILEVGPAWGIRLWQAWTAGCPTAWTAWTGQWEGRGWGL